MGRIKQVYMNLTDKMKEEDYNFVKGILREEEYCCFEKLLKSEQKHSVRLARNIENNIYFKDNSIIEQKDMLIKSALLHDVGKSTATITIFDKCVLVLLNKLTKGKLRNSKNKKVDCYYNHALYSYNMLNSIIYDEDILYIIKNHHHKTDDKLILFFQSMDDIS